MIIYYVHVYYILLCSVKYVLFQLFTAISVEGDNGPGNVATSAFTGSLKAAIPGKCYYYYLLQYPSLCNLYYQSFQYVFAPSYSKAPYQDEVTQYTGLSSSWWSDFSVAALCKTMYDLTTKLRPALNVDKITADISDYDEHLKGTWKYYAYVFMKENSQFSEAFGSLSADDIVKYRNMYIRDGLLSSTWIMAKKTQLSEGTWRDPGPTWEMFHHSIKLHLLGAGDADIDDVLNKLVDQGLLFPQEVRAANWREYFGWLDPDKILQSVKSDAAKGIMETRDCPWIVPCCFGSPEYQSFRFTESKQPGHKYRN